MRLAKRKQHEVRGGGNSDRSGASVPWRVPKRPCLSLREKPAACLTPKRTGKAGEQSGSAGKQPTGSLDRWFQTPKRIGKAKKQDGSACKQPAGSLDRWLQTPKRTGSLDRSAGERKGDRHVQTRKGDRYAQKRSSERHTQKRSRDPKQAGPSWVDRKGTQDRQDWRAGARETQGNEDRHGQKRKQDRGQWAPNRNARKQDQSGRKQERSGRKQGTRAMDDVLKTKTLQSCGDNMDGTRLDQSSNLAAPVTMFITEHVQLDAAKKRRKMLGDLFLRAMLLTELIPNGKMDSIIHRFPYVYTYIGADCSPGGAAFLGLSLEDVEASGVSRLQEALGVTNEEITAARSALCSKTVSYARVAGDLDTLLL